MSETRSIFITGAAAGIGRATARHFARRDWFVGLFDIDGVGLAQLAEELRAVHGAPMVTTGELDVTDPDQFNEAVQAFLAVSGRSEEHTSELQSLAYLVCRLLLEKKKKKLSHTSINETITNKRNMTSTKV